MNATCPQCRKSLKVKDEWAGKMLKCPACSTKFKAEAGGAPARPAAAAAPAASSGKSTVPVRAARQEKRAGIDINMNFVLLIGGVAAVLAVILMTVFGPVRVNRHWGAHQEQAENNVRDVIGYVLKVQASNDGSWDASKGRAAPSIGDLSMRPDIFRLSVPDAVDFVGFSTIGRFEGTYDFASGEVKGQFKLGGLMLPSGVFVDEEGTSVAGGATEKTPAGVAKKAAPSSGSIRFAGRSKGGVTAEIDGKKAAIYYAPKTDEDGNRL